MNLKFPWISNFEWGQLSNAHETQREKWLFLDMWTRDKMHGPKVTCFLGPIGARVYLSHPKAVHRPPGLSLEMDTGVCDPENGNQGGHRLDIHL